jgi:hypothetical protein
MPRVRSGASSQSAFTTADRLRTAEFDQRRRFRLDRHRGDQRRDVVGGDPPPAAVTPADDGDPARSHVEPTRRAKVDLLERVRPHERGGGTIVVMGGPVRWLLILAIALLLAGHAWIVAASRVAAPDDALVLATAQRRSRRSPVPAGGRRPVPRRRLADGTRRHRAGAEGWRDGAVPPDRAGDTSARRRTCDRPASLG